MLAAPFEEAHFLFNQGIKVIIEMSSHRVESPSKLHHSYKQLFQQYDILPTEDIKTQLNPASAHIEPPLA